MPWAMSLISRSRCSMATSFVWYRLTDVCWSIDWEKFLSASDSIMEGSVYGFWAGVEKLSIGVDRPPRVRSSSEKSAMSRLIFFGLSHSSSNCFVFF